MARAATVSGPPGGASPRGSRATVFGLDVHSEIPLSFLEGTTAAPTGRTLEISAWAEEAQEPSWPPSTELICNQLDLDGNVLFRIEAHRERGYRVSGPKHGVHLLSADGRRLRCDPRGCPDEVWQRLVIAQVLPFAALLQGLEVLHASAVALGGAAVALLGSSGAGKTSVALELCRLGGEFLADDVAALEIREEALLIHPGTQLAGLDHAEAHRLELVGAPRPESILASDERERLLRMDGASHPAPLAGLFFLDRRVDGPPEPSFEPIEDAKWLLSATFNFVLDTPDRLRGLLDVCALAARCRAERVLAGATADATQLAEAIERRMGQSP
jgi:hypothetical protein